MARLIWLQDGAQLLRSVRLTCRMTHAEFADALTSEAEWNVTAGVLGAWEDGIVTPPAQVVEAARRLARRRTTEFGRRQFLREAGTMAGLTLMGAGRDLRLAGRRGSGRHEQEPTTRPITVRGVLHPESLNDLENLVVDYRRSYGQASSSDLLGRAAGLVQILLDLQRSAAEPTSRDRLTGLLGEAALLAGLVSLMGPHDLPRAREYYQLALDAAVAVDDIDLATYVTGSLSFHDTRAGRLTDGLERVQAAQALADERCSPMTRAWLASLASELHARAGDELECKRLLEQADEALDTDPRWVTPWKGVGVFDAGKLVAYRGGDLVLLAAQARGAATATSAGRRKGSWWTRSRSSHRAVTSTAAPRWATWPCPWPSKARSSSRAPMPARPWTWRSGSAMPRASAAFDAFIAASTIGAITARSRTWGTGCCSP